MPDSQRAGKKDRDFVADVTDEIRESANRDRRLPKYENPNRDRARGDWDRSGHRATEPMSDETG
jgi:hypothetical protein